MKSNELNSGAGRRCRSVHVDPLDSGVRCLSSSTRREQGDCFLGASPRGSLALQVMSQARAAVAGRDYVIPDDVKALAEATLAHRLVVSPSARIRSADTRSIVAEILLAVPVPGTSPMPPRR